MPTNTVKISSEIHPDTKLFYNELNLTLADLQVIRQNLYNFHWNVEGEQFLELHDFFEEQYREIADHIDDLAERLKMLNIYPLATLSQILEHTRIEEPSVPMDHDNMLRKLSRDLTLTVENLRKVTRMSMERSDFSSFAMLSSMMETWETYNWKIKSMLK